jgi:hypothetical protein
MGRTPPLKRGAPDSGYLSAATTPPKRVFPSLPKRARLDDKDEEDGGLDYIRFGYPKFEAQ